MAAAVCDGAGEPPPQAPASTATTPIAGRRVRSWRTRRSSESLRPTGSDATQTSRGAPAASSWLPRRFPPDTKRRPVTEPLCRRSVAEDQLADGAVEIGPLERLRRRVEDLVAERGAAVWRGEEISGPAGVLGARSNEEASIRLLDVADRHLDRTSRRSAPGLEAKDLAPPGELFRELVHQALRSATTTLPGLPLGLDGRRIDHLDGLHVADRSRAERGHRLPERTDEVLRAIADAGRPEQELLQRPDGPDLDPRPAGQNRRRRRHAPVHPTPRRLLRPGQRRPEHENVRT